MSEWILVKDRLPTKEYKWIVCLINNIPILCSVHDSTFTFRQSKISFYWPKNEFIADDYFNQVTHWMPLPKPPGE